MKLKKLKRLKLLIFLFTICFFLHSNLYGQLNLSYDEFGITFKPQKCIDTLRFSIVKNFPNSSLVIYLKDCKGECLFELFDNKGRLKITGSFVNAIDTLIKYQFSKIRGTPIEKNLYGISTLKYFYPLKKGIWIYYDNEHKIVRSEDWDYLVN